MGIFDTTIYYTTKDVDIQSLGNHIKETFGEKYKVKLNEKHSGVKKLVTGNSLDSVLLTKNAYHRLSIGVSDSENAPTESGKREFYINFTQAPSKRWMSFLRKETGMIGGIVLKLIFGSADSFHSEIINEIEKKYDLNSRKVGLSTAFKKK